MRIVYSTAGVLLLALLLTYPMTARTSSGGASPGWTGGPGDNGTCQMCHSTFDLNSGTGSVAVNAPQGFVPGQSYQFTVTVENTTEPANGQPVQGFQLSVQDSEGNFMGQLVVVDPANTHLFSGANHITHTSDGRLEDSWTVGWIAPAEDVAPDSLTIYVAGNAANGDWSAGGDHIYTTTAVMQRQTTSVEASSVPGVFSIQSLFPNPVRNGSTTVRLTMEQTIDVELVIYDGRGRAVRTIDAGVAATGSHDLLLDLAGLSAGVYFLKVRTADGAAVRPFSVVR